MRSRLTQSSHCGCFVTRGSTGAVSVRTCFSRVYFPLRLQCTLLPNVRSWLILSTCFLPSLETEIPQENQSRVTFWLFCSPEAATGFLVEIIFQKPMVQSSHLLWERICVFTLQLAQVPRNFLKANLVLFSLRAAKVPFPLTLRFKPMLQQGIELLTLDASW